MAHFKVFKNPSNETILVNIDNITQVYANGDDECKIWFIQTDDWLRVKGTLDEVYFNISGKRL